MPAKNICHDVVVRALVADGWTITHDPLRISYGSRELYVDLGAEREALGAEKDGRKIAVEVRSFVGDSFVRDLEEAVGQYDIYQVLLVETEPDRVLYLAVPHRVQQTLLAERFGQLIVNRLGLRVLVFDESQERIVQWIESNATDRSSGR
jgi:hypothetical protein